MLLLHQILRIEFYSVFTTAAAVSCCRRRRVLVVLLLLVRLLRHEVVVVGERLDDIQLLTIRIDYRRHLLHFMTFLLNCVSDLVTQFVDGHTFQIKLLLAIFRPMTTADPCFFSRMVASLMLTYSRFYTH